MAARRYYRISDRLGVRDRRSFFSCTACQFLQTSAVPNIVQSDFHEWVPNVGASSTGQEVFSQEVKGRCVFSAPTYESRACVVPPFFDGCFREVLSNYDRVMEDVL